jgi:hypothetical protein
MPRTVLENLEQFEFDDDESPGTPAGGFGVQPSPTSLQAARFTATRSDAVRALAPYDGQALRWVHNGSVEIRRALLLLVGGLVECACALAMRGSRPHSRYWNDEHAGVDVTLSLVMDGRTGALVADVTLDSALRTFVVRGLLAGTYILRLSLKGTDGEEAGRTLSTFRLV